MLSLVSNIVGYLIGSSKEDESELNEEDELLDEDLIDAPFYVKAKDVAQRKAVDGKVTHVYHGHGLIDGHIYFSSDSVNGKEALKACIYYSSPLTKNL